MREGLLCLFSVHVEFKNNWLINIMWLISIFPIIFSWDFCIVVILIEVIFTFRFMWLTSCELFVRWI